VNTCLPQFHHLFETRRGHPAALYSTMLGLAGALTTFSPTLMPKDLPSYEHDNLGECFGDLDQKVRELLETVVPANYISLPLRRTPSGIHATALDQERYLTAPQIYLAVSSESAQPDLPQRVLRGLKISSSDQLDRLIKQALPGLGLTHLARPPAAVPIKVNYQYFQVNRSGPEWDAIVRSRNFAAYVPADVPNPQLELLLVLPRKE
jgi:type VI secretion system protein ImpJ